MSQDLGTAGRVRWQRPRLRVAGEDGDRDRHATWLELFYDLAFVVAVAQLAGILHEEISLGRFAAYAALFVPVWWAWAGQTFYANRFDTDDIGQRLLTMFQIVAIAVLAAAVPRVVEGETAPFAVAYAVVRGVLLMSYVRARRAVPEARPLIDRYLAGFSAAVLLWLAALAVPAPWRFGVWAAAVVLDLGTPLAARRHQAALPPQAHHLPERFGLFFVIVLGEWVVAVVAGLEERELAPGAILRGGLGIVLALSLWWSYFDDLRTSAIRRTAVAGQVWVFAHLPLFIATAAAAIGVEHLVLAADLHTGERWLAAGAVAAVLTVPAVLDACSRRSPRTPLRLAGAVAVVVLGLLSAGWRPEALLASLAAVCAAQVAGDIAVLRRPT